MKNFITYFSLTFLQKGISFIMLPIYTMILSPSEFGIFNQIIAITTIFILLLTFGLDDSAAKHYFDSDSEDLKSNTLSTTFIICITASILGSFILFFLKDIIFASIVDGITLEMMIATIIIISTGPTYLIYQKILRIKEKAKEFSILSLFYLVGQVSLAILFIEVFDLNAFGLLLSHSILAFCMFIYCLIRLIKKFNFSYDKKQSKKLLKYSSKVAPHKIAGWGLTGFSITIMGYYLGSSAIGIFGAVAFLGIIVDTLNKAFELSYQPWIYNQLNDKKNGIKKIIHATKTLSIVFIALSAFLTFFSKEFIEILIDKRYHDGIILAPLIITGSISVLFGSLFTFILYYKEDLTLYASKATIISGICNIILSIIMIPKFGIIGGVASLTIAKMLYCWYKQYHAWKNINSSIYSFIYFYFLCIVIMILGTYFIQNSTPFFPRLILIATILLVTYFRYRNWIFNFLKTQ